MANTIVHFCIKQRKGDGRWYCCISVGGALSNTKKQFESTEKTLQDARRTIQKIISQKFPIFGQRWFKESHLRLMYNKEHDMYECAWRIPEKGYYENPLHNLERLV